MITAITGGIGSGKTYICRLLERRNIRVYDCDEAAKRLIRGNLALQKSLSEAVGEELFPGGKLDKARLSRFIIASEANALTVDNIVHPAVARDFLASGLTWIESAILFESGFNKRINAGFTVCVTAPLETRIARIMRRDGLTREKALDWINRQMTQEEKLRLSDFELPNDDNGDADTQISRLLETLALYNKV